MHPAVVAGITTVDAQPAVHQAAAKVVTAITIIYITEKLALMEKAAAVVAAVLRAGTATATMNSAPARAMVAVAVPAALPSGCT